MDGRRSVSGVAGPDFDQVVVIAMSCSVGSCFEREVEKGRAPCSIWSEKWR